MKRVGVNPLKRTFYATATLGTVLAPCQPDGGLSPEKVTAMLTRDLLRKHHDLMVRFKQIQERFEKAKTVEQQRRALKEMRQLSDETRSLLNSDYIRLTGA